METDQTYLAKAREALTKLEAQLDDLRKKASDAEGSARERLDAQIADLETRMAKVRADVSEAVDGAADRSADLQTRTQNALDELWDGMKRAYTQLAA